MLTMPVWIHYFALHIGLILSIVCPLYASRGSPVTSRKCLEGTVQSHSQDCSSYWQCLNGEIVIQRCPPQSYFDPAWEVCVIDLSGICVAATAQCLEGQIDVIPGNSCGYFRCVNGSLVEEKCQLGSFFNASLKICEVDESGICTGPTVKCVDDQLEEHPKDCAGYLKCVNGSLVEEKCSNGSYFNNDLKICEIDENGICTINNGTCTEGALEEDPEHCAGYLKCVNGTLVEEKCSNGSFFNVDLNICEIDENGTCIPKNGICTEGSLKKDSADCAGYLKCINGSLVEEKCSNGSYFNNDLKICEIDENGICTVNNGTCTEGALEEDPEHCAGYLKCVNGTLVEEKCSKGSYFNNDFKICEIDENGTCVPKNGTCTEGSLEKDPEECAGYLRCVNGIEVQEKCAIGSYFNTSLNICEIDENGICISKERKCIEGSLEEDPEDCAGYLICIDGRVTEEKCNKGSFFNADLKICEIDENGVCIPKGERCTEGSLEQDPRDCAGYLICVNGSLVKEKCTKGSFFNVHLKICEIDENGICGPKPEKCSEGSLEEDPKDCSGYLRCVDGTLVEEKCARGSFFNPDLKVCEIDETGVCIRKLERCFEDELEENPVNRCGYLRCTYGNLEEFNCAKGRYYNASLEMCMIDDYGVCTGVEKCANWETRVDPDDCAGYLECVDGELIKKLCSYGSYYHTILHSCVVDDEGICIPLSEHCKEGEREADSEDCASYLECIDGDFMQQRCANGSYYDAGFKACRVPTQLRWNYNIYP